MTEFRSYANTLTRLVKRRFENPGMTYNAGNCLALIAPALQFLISTDGNLAATTRNLEQYFAGNAPSVATTFTSLLFFCSSWNYDRAWDNGFPPDEGKNRWGHGWSAAGAALLTIGMALLSKSQFSLAAAIIGGTLHAGGKAGSLADPQRDWLYKLLPLTSRPFMMASLIEDIRENFTKYPHVRDGALHSVLQTLLLGCNLLWGRADIMLMPEGPVREVLHRVLLIPATKPGPSS